MDLFKVKGHQELRKDSRTGALLLSDKNKANEYLTKRRVFENDAAMGAEINTLKESVSDLKSDMDDIKKMLQQLIRTNG